MVRDVDELAAHTIAVLVSPADALGVVSQDLTTSAGSRTHRENMLLTPEGTIAVIDFDDYGPGAYTLDIATVLSSIHRLCRDEPEVYADFASRFLAAYEKFRPLPASMDRFESFLLLRDAFIVHFVTSSTNSEVATWGPRRVAGLITQMRAHLDGQPYPGTIAT
ncbi:phosphotransferase [Streptomyces sp. NPDC054961]